MASHFLQPFLEFQLGQWQVYGLFFLLGTLAVASWSDLKHMQAQSEFVEVWAALLVVLALLDLEAGRARSDAAVVLKWGLILAFSALSWERIGILFKVAKADVFAMAAVASLLSPLLVVAFYVTMKLVATILERVLSGGRDTYPFLPVVAVSTALVISVAAAAGWAAGF